MATREEALAKIDEANKAMANAASLAQEAKKLSAESGILTAADIIQAGLQEASTGAFATLPTVNPYVGVQSTQADYDAVVKAEQDVKDQATMVGHLLAVLTKVAIKVAMSAGV